MPRFAGARSHFLGVEMSRFSIRCPRTGDGRRSSTTWVLFAALVASQFIPAASAQSTFGSFVGTIRDDSGGLIVDCVVTLKDLGTASERSVLTDKDGNYVLLNINPGTYQITMLAPGFRPTVHDKL